MVSGVQAAAQGNSDAYARLVDANRNAVCSIALAVVRDVQASEDVAQEVFLAGWENLKKLRNPNSFLPWLRQLTRNKANDYLRDKVRTRKYVLDDGTDAALANVVDPSANAVTQVLNHEERTLVAQAIDELGKFQTTAPDEDRYWMKSRMSSYF